MATSVTGTESWSNSTATSIYPTGTATGNSGNTSVGTLNCVPCCNSGVRYLPGWFSYADPSKSLKDGLCPGIVDNSAPVTVYATFNLTPAPGISLSDYCIPSSFTIEMIADNPYYPSRLRPLSYVTTCSPIYPGTRYGFLNINGKGFITASYNTGSSPSIDAYLVDMCSCVNVGYLVFGSYYIPTDNTFFNTYNPTIYGKLDSCSPFSVTFSKSFPNGQDANLYWYPSTWVSTWSVTFTL